MGSASAAAVVFFAIEETEAKGNLYPTNAEEIILERYWWMIAITIAYK